MIRKLSLAMAIAAALGTTDALALGLGDIHLKSALNQTLEADIDLLEVAEGDIDGIKVQLASADAFSKAGLDRPSALTDLRFEAIRKKDGKNAIKVTSTNPIREPFLNFLIEVNWSQGKLLREYTLLLDPPTTLKRTPPAVQPAAIKEPPAPVRRQQAPTPPPPAPAEESKRPAKTKAAPAVAKGGSYNVRNNDSVWKIAERRRPSGVSMEEMMVAIYKANPDAFYGGSINNLKSGAILRMPNREEMANLTYAQARNEYISQVSAWQSTTYTEPPVEKRPTDEKAPPAEPKPEQQAQTAPPPVPATATEKPAPQEHGDRVEILAPKPDGKGPAGDETGKAQVENLKKDLLLAREATESARQEGSELKSRVRDLESQVSDLERLIKLKNDKLAQMQAMADEKEKEKQQLTSEKQQLATEKAEVEKSAAEKIATEKAAVERVAADKIAAEKAAAEAAIQAAKLQAEKAHTGKPETAKSEQEKMAEALAKLSGDIPKKPNGVQQPPQEAAEPGMEKPAPGEEYSGTVSRPADGKAEAEKLAAEKAAAEKAVADKAAADKAAAEKAVADKAAADKAAAEKAVAEKAAADKAAAEKAAAEKAAKEAAKPAQPIKHPSGVETTAVPEPGKTQVQPTTPEKGETETSPPGEEKAPEKRPEQAKPQPQPKPPIQPPVKPPVQTPPPPAEEGVLDLLLSPMVLGAGGGIAALLGGMFWMRNRGQRKPTRNNEIPDIPVSELTDDDSIPVSFEDSEPIGRGRSGQRFDDEDTSSSFLTDFTPSELEQLGDETADVDPASESDVYMAYGRYQQAQELMKEAVEREPDRDDHKLKYLEVLHAGNAKANFIEMANRFAKTGLRERDPAGWNRIARLGREFAPNDKLFVDVPVTAAAAAPTPKKPGPAPAAKPGGKGLEFEEFNLTEADLDDNDLSLSSLGKEFTEQQAANKPKEQGKGKEKGAAGEPSALSSLDFMLDTRQEGETAPEFEDLDFEGLDFGLDNFDKKAEKPEEKKPASAPAKQGEDFLDDISAELADLFPSETKAPAAKPAVKEAPKATLASTAAPKITVTPVIKEPPKKEPEPKPAPKEEEETPFSFDLESFDFEEFAKSGSSDSGRSIFDSPASTPAPATGKGKAKEDDLNFDLGDLNLELEASEIGPDEEEPPSRHSAEPDLDDLSANGLDLDHLEALSELRTGTVDRESFGLYGLADLPPTEQIDEIQTKLELAQAYQEMGDDEGARSILEEVLDEGNDAQKAAAKKLLNSLKG